MHGVLGSPAASSVTSSMDFGILTAARPAFSREQSRLSTPIGNLLLPPKVIGMAISQRIPSTMGRYSGRSKARCSSTVLLS